MKTTFRNLRIAPILSLICIVMMMQSCTKTLDGTTFQDYSIPTTFNHYALQMLNDSVFFIGSGKLYDSGFVYKSTDQGKSWSLLNNGLNGGVYGIQFKNEKEGIATTWNTNIYQTKNGGNTFGYYSKNYDNIITSPLYLNDSTIVAVSHMGYGSGYFWSTNNGGSSWDTLNFGRNCARIIMNNNQLFISGYGMIYQAESNFKQWKATVVEGDLWVDIDFPSYNTGFIVGFDGAIRKTVNRGETWISMRTGNHLLNKSYTLTQADFYNEHIGIVGTYQGDLLYTNDGGYTWQAITTPFKKTIRDLKMLNARTGIAIGDQGLIFKFYLP